MSDKEAFVAPGANCELSTCTLSTACLAAGVEAVDSCCCCVRPVGATIGSGLKSLTTGGAVTVG